MTRVNLVPPAELTDQHLFAEYRELKMIPKSLRRSIKARGIEQVLKTIPKEFTLNKGHVSFFYDKAYYLEVRYSQIEEELEKRGYQFNRLSKLDEEGIFVGLNDNRFWGEYTPTVDALILIRARIRHRINEKPDFYKYYGRSINVGH